MATSQALFKWNNGRFTSLIKCLQEFKSCLEFRNCDSNADKVKLYESVRIGQTEIYEDEPDTFGPASVSENPYKVLDVNEFDFREYQVKVKTEKEQIKRGYSRLQKRVKNLRQKFYLLEAIIFQPGLKFFI